MNKNKNFRLEAGQKRRQTGQNTTENLAILSVRLASESSGLNGFEIIRATSEVAGMISKPFDPLRREIVDGDGTVVGVRVRSICEHTA